MEDQTNLASQMLRVVWWTRNTIINKQVLADIGKRTVPTSTSVQARYKDSEKLRTMVDVSTGIFEAIQAIFSGGEGVPPTANCSILPNMCGAKQFMGMDLLSRSMRCM
ncbi:hypothetical protein CLU79DRAFT_774975, partial [Phycomyces nitens]